MHTRQTPSEKEEARFLENKQQERSVHVRTCDDVWNIGLIIRKCRRENSRTQPKLQQRFELLFLVQYGINFTDWLYTKFGSSNLFEDPLGISQCNHVFCRSVLRTRILFIFSIKLWLWWLTLNDEANALKRIWKNVLCVLNANRPLGWKIWTEFTR